MTSTCASTATRQRRRVRRALTKARIDKYILFTKEQIMKKLFPIICLLSLLLSGCFIVNLHNKLFNPPDCSKPSPFSTVIITPFSTAEVLIEGITEGKEMTNIAGGLKGITNRLGESLKDKLTEYKKFDKISQGSECGDRSIKVEGKIIDLAHIHRTGFVLFVRGEILNCTTGGVWGQT
jgi:hypothetical protein